MEVREGNDVEEKVRDSHGILSSPEVEEASVVEALKRPKVPLLAPMECLESLRDLLLFKELRYLLRINKDKVITALGIPMTLRMHPQNSQNPDRCRLVIL